MWQSCRSPSSNFIKNETRHLRFLNSFANFSSLQLYYKRDSSSESLNIIPPATFRKARLRRMCFRVNFAKVLRTPILWNTCERLFLIICRFFCKIFCSLKWKKKDIKDSFFLKMFGYLSNLFLPYVSMWSLWKHQKT